MLQRLFARLRWPLWRSARSRTQTAARAGVTAQPATAGGRHRRGGPAQPAPVAAETAAPAQPPGNGPFASPLQEAHVRPARSSRPGKPSRAEAPGRGGGRRVGAARAAVRDAPRASAAARAEQARAAQARQRVAVQVDAKASWHQAADARRVAVGYRDCGPLEKVLHRDWVQDALPPPEVVRVIVDDAETSLYHPATVPRGRAAINLLSKIVPALERWSDAISPRRRVVLASPRSFCAGVERAIDVVCHEVGHALDDLDGSGSKWQSDSDEFRALYGRCLPRLVSDFHRQDGSLGPREFFADAFAAIASSQRPALVDMLGGDTRTALDVMLYFNVRYGI